jgi:hypothetical protein
VCVRREPPPLHDSPSLCLQLRVIRAFKSTLEDLEERRSVHSLHSLHSLRSSRSHPGPRPLSDISYIDADDALLKTPSSPSVDPRAMLNLLTDYTKSANHSPSSSYSSNVMMKMISPAEDPHLVPSTNIPEKQDYLGAGLFHLQQKHGLISLPAITSTADDYCFPPASYYTTSSTSANNNNTPHSISFHAQNPPYVLVTSANNKEEATFPPTNDSSSNAASAFLANSSSSTTSSSPPSSPQTQYSASLANSQNALATANELQPLLQSQRQQSQTHPPNKQHLQQQQQYQPKKQQSPTSTGKALYQPLSPLHLQNVSPQTQQRNLIPHLPDLPKLVHETSI